MLNDPTFWVATAFIAFLMLIVYLGVIKKITFSLDERTEKIKNDIEQAEQLCKEAQDLLSHYQKKQRDALKEADTIAENAKKDAQEIIKNGRKQIELSMLRREELIKSRIHQSEMAALEKIRLQTVELVINATRNILKTFVTEEKINETIDASIKHLGKSL